MSNGVTWIDDIDVEVDGTVIVATVLSGKVRSDYRMSRAKFREYIERARRQLNEADEADRCVVLPWKQIGH